MPGLRGRRPIAPDRASRDQGISAASSLPALKAFGFRQDARLRLVRAGLGIPIHPMPYSRTQGARSRAQALVSAIVLQPNPWTEMSFKARHSFGHAWRQMNTIFPCRLLLSPTVVRSFSIPLFREALNTHHATHWRLFSAGKTVPGWCNQPVPLDSWHPCCPSADRSAGL